MNDILMTFLAITIYIALAATILILDRSVNHQLARQILSIIVKKFDKDDIEDTNSMERHIESTDSILRNQMIRILTTDDEGERVRDELHEIIALLTSNEDETRIYELITKLKGVKTINRGQKCQPIIFSRFNQRYTRRTLKDIIEIMRQEGFLDWHIATKDIDYQYNDNLKSFKIAIQSFKSDIRSQMKRASHKVIHDLMRIIIDEFFESALTLQDVKQIIEECTRQKHLRISKTISDEEEEIRDPIKWIGNLNRANAWNEDKLELCNHRSGLCCFARLADLEVNSRESEIAKGTYGERLSTWIREIEFRKALKIMIESEIQDECPHNDERSINRLGKVCNHCRCRGWTDHYLPYTPTDSDDENEGTPSNIQDQPRRMNLGIKRIPRLLH